MTDERQQTINGPIEATMLGRDFLAEHKERVQKAAEEANFRDGTEDQHGV